ncbi:MAG: peptidase M61, partial [Gammaproteobacteria bacterium]|nr:peptidase M61 [Gammaproteobacteria bacterium]
MASQPARVHYKIVPVDPGGHIFDVNCVIATPDPDGQRLSLPSWIPGSYLVRDFAGSLVDLEAHCNGQPVEAQKIDKSAWQCAPCDGALTVHYHIYANDLSVRGAHLDITHGYFNGPRVFLRVDGQEDARCTVRVERNPNERFGEWHLATSMRRADAEPQGFGVYEAADYEELIDHPFEMGTFQTQYFEAHGIPHQLVVTGKHHGDLGRVARDLKSICEQQMEFFGLPAPIDRYVFLLTVLGSGYGGLEHRWSSSLMARREDLPCCGQEKVTDNYRSFLGLASHEYFHLWNVKRIRPAAVAESDLSREAYTRQLWVFEGITSYYDDMFLLRSGAISVDAYLQLISNTA